MPAAGWRTPKPSAQGQEAAMKRTSLAVIRRLALALGTVVATAALVQGEPQPLSKEEQAKVDQAIDKAIAFLKGMQPKKGNWEQLLGIRATQSEPRHCRHWRCWSPGYPRTTRGAGRPSGSARTWSSWTRPMSCPSPCCFSTGWATRRTRQRSAAWPCGSWPGSAAAGAGLSLPYPQPHERGGPAGPPAASGRRR